MIVGRGKFVSDNIVQITECDAMHYEINVVGINATGPEGDQIEWFNKQRAEIYEVLKDVSIQRMQNSKSKWTRNNAVRDFSEPELWIGNTVRLAYGFRKNCLHEGFIFNKHRGRYTNLNIYPEKLVVYVFNPLMQDNYDTCCESTSRYFEDKKSDVGPPTPMLKRKIGRKKKSTEKQACPQSRKGYKDTARCEHQMQNQHLRLHTNLCLLNCNDDKDIEHHLLNSLGNDVKLSPSDSTNTSLEYKGNKEITDDQENHLNQRTRASSRNKRSSSEDLRNTLIPRKRAKSVNEDSEKNEGVNDLDSIATFVSWGKHDTEPAKRHTRSNSAQKVESDAIFTNNVNARPGASQDTYQTNNLGIDFEPPRSPTPPPDDFIEISKSVPKGVSKMMTKWSATASGSHCGQWLSKETGCAQAQAKKSKSRAERKQRNLKRKEKVQELFGSDSDSPAENCLTTALDIDGNKGDSKHNTCIDQYISPKSKRLAKLRGSSVETLTTLIPSGPKIKAEEEDEQKPNPIKFKKTLTATKRRESLDMETLMEKYKHWPDNQLCQKEGKTALPRSSSTKCHRSSSGSSRANANQYNHDDSFQDCFIKEESKTQSELDLSAKEIDTLEKEIKSLTEVNELKEIHLAYLVHNNEKYLREIFQGKRKSRRHADYKKGGTIRANLNWQIPLGMYEEYQTDIIMDALRELFCKTHNKYLDYLMRVMLPEILIKIYMDLKNLEYEETERLLDNY